MNAKRTVLSKGVRTKIEQDNCGMLGGKRLKGWNDEEFNDSGESGGGSDVQKRLVRGFFGHTRFATSSKASLDGTHPHQWTPRRTLTCYGFQSRDGAIQNEEGLGVDVSGHPLDVSVGKNHAVGTGMVNNGPDYTKVMRVGLKGQLMGVENFVTHNGKCDRFNWR